MEDKSTMARVEPDLNCITTFETPCHLTFRSSPPITNLKLSIIVTLYTLLS